ncbi:MAG: hypothetical protein HQ517_00350, partial [SAR324 cluster bacterium]|nr:hypothetical protein [SAR324 cluster bacterium]
MNSQVNTQKQKLTLTVLFFLFSFLIAGFTLVSGTQYLYAGQSTQFLPPYSFSDLAEKAGPA